MVAAGDLKIDRDYERFRRLFAVFRGTQSVHDAIIGSSEDVVEFRVGSEPINAGRIHQPLAGGDFSLFGGVIRSTEGE